MFIGLINYYNATSIITNLFYLIYFYYFYLSAAQIEDNVSFEYYEESIMRITTKKDYTLQIHFSFM